jgi:hypothetical protein
VSYGIVIYLLLLTVGAAVIAGLSTRNAAVHRHSAT